MRSHWTRAAEGQENAAAQVPAERSAGTVESWPSFAQIQERVVLEAARLAKEFSQYAPEDLLIEERMVGQTVPFRGTVDLVSLDKDRNATVIDYKSGSVAPDDVAPGGRYLAQMLIYAALCRDAGFHPTTGELRPIGRQPVRIAIDDELIDRSIDGIIREVDSYNDTARKGEIGLLANPGDEACRWCEQLTRCPAIWDEAEPPLQEVQALDGTVTAVEQSRVGRISLSIQSTRGTRRGPVIIAGLDGRRFPFLSPKVVGRRLRRGWRFEPGFCHGQACRSGW